MLYYQSMHKNFEDKKRKKHIYNLIDFFNFHFLVESHHPDHPLFEQTFFRKKNFFFFNHFQHSIFFINPFLFQHVIFFTTFHLTLNKVFSKKMNTTFIFSTFLFLKKKIKIKNHSISGKKQNENSFFCIFFKNSKHIFYKSTKFRILEIGRAHV